ncbi:hypothetical protein [Halomonas caseinilytica]|uniref:Uncharacterized protein n=1 Tax=Halomonas caseinilytica TaxID=438744 RepID=A0A1M6T8U0_9GAMM|nr:hypothetical protein [Halomonas caseinilytica]SHK53370.1 hypothetical protein SAMN05192556_103253 [Halomonas caseinilytica]
MATVRQPITNVLVINKNTGAEYAKACLEVCRRKDGAVELLVAEAVVEPVQHPSEVLLISDRGTCWHRFHTGE